MNREDTAKLIKVMQHYVDGGEVGLKHIFFDKQDYGAVSTPTWDWKKYEY